MTTDKPVRVGVLALQGSFREHMSLLQKIPGVAVIEVRRPNSQSAQRMPSLVLEIVWNCQYL